MKYRISLGLDLSVWNNTHTDRLTGTVLSNEEAATMEMSTGATAIFYTENPDDVIMELMSDGFSLTDFRWINISME